MGSVNIKTAAVIATEQQKAAALAAKASEAETVKETQDLKSFMQAGPSGIDTYIDNNVSDLSSAREVMKKLAKIVWSLGWRNFDDE